VEILDKLLEIFIVTLILFMYHFLWQICNDDGGLNYHIDEAIVYAGTNIDERTILGQHEVESYIGPLCTIALRPLSVSLYRRMRRPL
jgi:hypothetical protein